MRSRRDSLQCASFVRIRSLRPFSDSGVFNASLLLCRLFSPWLRSLFPILLVSSLVPRPSSLLFAEDLELSDLSLPKLVLPAETTARLRLPDVIVKKNEWRGVQCAVTEPRVAVFRHADTWAAFWEKAMAPYSPKLSQVPRIDFEKDMVIGVFLGEKTTPNYEVVIVKVGKPSQEAVEVRYREIRKMQGVFTPPFVIQPFHLKAVPAFVGQVRFQPDHK